MELGILIIIKIIDDGIILNWNNKSFIYKLINIFFIILVKYYYLIYNYIKNYFM